MAYNEDLAQRLRQHLLAVPIVEEKKMFGGICFMVDEKMCVGVFKNDLMCRIDPERMDELLEHPSARPMDFAKQPMIGYIYVDESGYSTARDLQKWIDLCLEFNPRATSSKNKKRKMPK